uniref:Putative secreted peptide n=1 Tax=Anopheles braziliensis TaxID=58242 RepID=A0A2M3ZQ31_9DIPT
MMSITFLLSLAAAAPAAPLLLLFTALLKATLETIMPYTCQSSFHLHYCFIAIELGKPAMQCLVFILSIFLTKLQQEYKEHNFAETHGPRGLLVARVLLRLHNNGS